MKIYLVLYVLLILTLIYYTCRYCIKYLIGPEYYKIPLMINNSSSSNYKIDKNIFQSWYTTQLPPEVQEKIDSFKKLNPEYAYYLYTDDDMDNFVNENFKGEILECYNKLNIIVAKVDFWRYLVLYKYGGAYLDMDSDIKKSLNELIKPDDSAIITAENHKDLYVQWALIFSKEHPVLKKTIELIIDNIKNNRYPNDIHKMTGPTVYSKAINEVHEELFNEPIDHEKITENTDITYKSNNVSYRIYGIDYNTYFSFAHTSNSSLYNKKRHWSVEQAEKKLLK